MKFSVTRAAWRPVAYALLAVPMVILAVDMVITHKFIPAPETTPVTVTETLADGTEVERTFDQLTETGKAQRRRDTAWGIGLFVGGVAAAAWGLKDLVFPRRILTLDGDQLVLCVSGRAAAEHRYSWDEIADVRSGVIEDEGGTVPVLSLRLVDDALLPRSPWGAVVAPPWLHLYAAEWDLQAHDLVPMIETHLNRARQSVAEE